MVEEFILEVKQNVHIPKRAIHQLIASYAIGLVFLGFTVIR